MHPFSSHLPLSPLFSRVPLPAHLPHQAMQLSARPHVVVATPGRLREMMQQEASMGRIFSNLQVGGWAWCGAWENQPPFLVSDEADRLLDRTLEVDRGFEEEIAAILLHLPALPSASPPPPLRLPSASPPPPLRLPSASPPPPLLLPSASPPPPLRLPSASPPPPLRLPLICVSCDEQEQDSRSGGPDVPLPTLQRARRVMSKSKKLFHFEAYEGFKTVEALDQSYLFLPANLRDMYLCRLLSRLLPSLQTILPPAPPPSASAAARPPVRSVIVFTSSCQSCQAVSALLDEVGLSNAPLHALLPQSCQAVSALLDEVGLSNAPLHALLPQRKRSAALHRFKASQVPILVATDVASIVVATDIASRGLDIPTADKVINYDIPR
ncbi:unnamed protein product [Closterium sp. Naga37s-1]|nr:unnamed protein product [Closterium sp. Naga37s-1]